MKHFNKIFDIFLYEGVFIFFFGSLLYLLDDRFTGIFIKTSVISIAISGVHGLIGYSFNLFLEEQVSEEA